jgi:hypothetical protein
MMFSDSPWTSFEALLPLPKPLTVSFLLCAKRADQRSLPIKMKDSNMKKTTLKTSAKWLENFESRSDHSITLMDPDGWDRKNYEFSFNEEEITREEFTSRLNRSTLMLTAKT